MGEVTYEQVVKLMALSGLVPPATYGDGVRSVSAERIPLDAPAEVDGSVVSVRVPASHHRKQYQGWLYGVWLRDPDAGGSVLR